MATHTRENRGCHRPDKRARRSSASMARESATDPRPGRAGVSAPRIEMGQTRLPRDRRGGRDAPHRPATAAISASATPPPPRKPERAEASLHDGVDPPGRGVELGFLEPRSSVRLGLQPRHQPSSPQPGLTCRKECRRLDGWPRAAALFGTAPRRIGAEEPDFCGGRHSTARVSTARPLPYSARSRSPDGLKSRVVADQDGGPSSSARGPRAGPACPCRGHWSARRAPAGWPAWPAPWRWSAGCARPLRGSPRAGAAGCRGTGSRGHRRRRGAAGRAPSPGRRRAGSRSPKGSGRASARHASGRVGARLPQVTDPRRARAGRAAGGSGGLAAPSGDMRCGRRAHAGGKPGSASALQTPCDAFAPRSPAWPTAAGASRGQRALLLRIRSALSARSDSAPPAPSFVRARVTPGPDSASALDHLVCRRATSATPQHPRGPVLELAKPWSRAATRRPSSQKKVG